MKTCLIQFNSTSSEWFCAEYTEGPILPRPYGEVYAQGIFVSVFTHGVSQSSAYFLGMCLINNFLREHNIPVPLSPFRKKFRQLVRYAG